MISLRMYVLFRELLASFRKSISHEGINFMSGRLIIQKRGIVKSGYVDYSLDGVNGTVTYKGSVKVKVLVVVTKTVEFADTYQVGSDVLRSIAYVLGAVLELGPVIATVASVTTENGKKYAYLNLELPDGGEGEGCVCLDKELISIRKVDIKTTVKGKDIEIYAEQDTGE